MNIRVDDKTKLAVSFPLRVWVGGIFGFAGTIGVFFAGWHDLESRSDARFGAVMSEVASVKTQVDALDDRWQLRLIEFGEKFAHELGGRQEIVTLRERQHNVLQSLEDIKRRLDKLEAKGP